MASDPITTSAEQHCVIKFLVKENVKPAEILPSPSAENGKEIPSHTSVYHRCNKISEGHEEVAN
jgi:hypothetical protein